MRRQNLTTLPPRGSLGLERLVASWTGADSPEVIASAKALVKGLKRVLSVRGGGAPAPPGQPPRKQRGSLARSPKHGKRAEGRVVAITDFKGLFHEKGVDTSKPSLSKRRRRGKARLGRRMVPARPFMQRGLDLSEAEMIDDTVDVAALRAAELTALE